MTGGTVSGRGQKERGIVRAGEEGSDGEWVAEDLSGPAHPGPSGISGGVEGLGGASGGANLNLARYAAASPESSARRPAGRTRLGAGAGAGGAGGGAAGTRRGALWLGRPRGAPAGRAADHVLEGERVGVGSAFLADGDARRGAGKGVIGSPSRGGHGFLPLDWPAT